jgi:hypothetical protein
MRQSYWYHAILPAVALCLPAAGHAQSGTGPAKPAVQQDTTIRYIIPGSERVPVALLGGHTYAAVLSGKGMTLLVRPTLPGLRVPAVGDATLPDDSTVTRFTVIVQDTGVFVFSLEGVMAGHDTVMWLTGPPPVKKKDRTP